MLVSVICFGLLVLGYNVVDKPKQVTEVVVIHKPIKVQKFSRQELNNVVELKKKVIRKVVKRVRKSPSRGGRLEYIAEASGYTWTGNRTASGVYPKSNHTIAVDSDYIPIGARVRIYTMDDKLVGIFVAEDTGGAIKYKVTGRMIDIYFDTKQECINWGVRRVKIYVD